MALEKQTLSLNFEKGLNQKASDRILNVPHMADIKNGRMEKSGEIRRRAGLDPLTSGNIPNNVTFKEDQTSDDDFTKVAGLKSFRDGLLLLDGKNAYQKLNDNSYIRQGVCDSVIMRNDVLRDDRGFTQSRPELARIDDATYGNFICAVWYEVDSTRHSQTQGSAVTTYYIYAQIYDADTMLEVGKKQLVDINEYETHHTTFRHEKAYIAPRPRCLALGTHFVILYNAVYSSSCLLNYRLIDISQSSTKFQLGAVKPSATTSTLDIGLFSCWDACTFKRSSTDPTVEGVAIFAQLRTGTVSFTLTEFKIDSGALSTTGMRSAYTIDHSAQARLELDYTVDDPHAYGMFVRHFQPNASHSTVGNRDDAACYMLGFNAKDTVAKARFNVVDASSSTLSSTGGVVNEPDSRGMLNGSAVLDPGDSPSTKIRVYYVTDTRNGLQKPNATILTAVEVQIDDASTTFNNIAYNTGLLSDPWVYDNEIYFMGSEAIAQQAMTDWEHTYKDFGQGNTFIFRDSLKNTPSAKTFKRDRCIPVAVTGQADVACNPFINFFHLERDFEIAASSFIGELASTMYFGACSVIDGKTPDEKLIGNCSMAPLLVGDEVTQSNALVTVNHKPRRELPAVETNNTLLMGGGYLKCFDGSVMQENGFFRAPQFYQEVTKGTGTINGQTAKIETGTYSYTAIYEFVDSAGNIHRSGPSAPMNVEFASGSDNYVTISVWSYNHSLRYYENVRVVLYRTTKDQSTHYRVGDVANNWDTEYVQFRDITKDDELFPTENPEAAHEILYSDFEKPNGTIGSVKDIVLHKNRPVAVTTDNRVHAFKPSVRTVAPEVYSIAEFQFGDIEGGKENVYGIETTGEHLLVFGRDNIYVISGEGPDSDGGTARFTDARLLIKGQGSVEGTIHINHAKGVLYQSPRGIYNINRELVTEYIGAPVEDLGLYRALAVDLDDSKHEVYIPLGGKLDGSSDAAGLSTVLVYNYFFDAWTQYSFDKDYVGYNSKGLKFLNGTLYYGRMRYASYSGRTDTYDLDSSVASGTWQVNEANFWDTKYGSTETYSKYSTEVETPFIYLNNLQGAQRVYKTQFLGNYKGDHDITVEMTVDYDASTAHSQTKTASTLTDKNVYQVPVKRQKNRAIKIKHSVTPNSSSTLTNEMFRMDGIALEVGFRPTTFAAAKGDKF